MKILFSSIICLFLVVFISCDSKNESNPEIESQWRKNKQIQEGLNEVNAYFKTKFILNDWEKLKNDKEGFVNTSFINKTTLGEIEYIPIPIYTINNSKILKYKDSKSFFLNVQPVMNQLVFLLKYKGQYFAISDFEYSPLTKKWRLSDIRVLHKSLKYWKNNEQKEKFFLGVLADKDHNESILIRKYCCHFENQKCFWVSTDEKEKYEFNDFLSTPFGKILSNQINKL